MMAGLPGLQPKRHILWADKKIKPTRRSLGLRGEIGAVEGGEEDFDGAVIYLSATAANSGQA
jgi:hypothetical protein